MSETSPAGGNGHHGSAADTLYREHWTREGFLGEVTTSVRPGISGGRFLSRD